MKLSVEKMKCSGCATAVTTALSNLDPHAAINVDLDSNLVVYDGVEDANSVVAALSAAGYPASVRE